MGGAKIEPLVGGLHLRTRLRGADALQLNHQQVELQDELPDVLVLPHALVYLLWWVTNTFDVRGVVA